MALNSTIRCLEVSTTPLYRGDRMVSDRTDSDLFATPSTRSRQRGTSVRDGQCSSGQYKHGQPLKRQCVFGAFKFCAFSLRIIP